MQRETNLDILCLKYTEDNEFLAVGFTDGSVRIFNAEDMNLEKTLIDEEILKVGPPVTAMMHRPVLKRRPVFNMLTCTCMS